MKYILLLFIWIVAAIDGKTSIKLHQSQDTLYPIVFSDTLYEQSVVNGSQIYVDCKKEKTLQSDFKILDFTIPKLIKLPDRFNSGSCHTWLRFRISNPYTETKNILFTGNIDGDSLLVQNSEGTYIHVVNEPYIKLNKQTNRINGHNRLMIELPPMEVTEFLFLQKRPVYDASTLFPLISNSEEYDIIYSHKKNGVASFYLVVSTFIAVMLLITLFYYILLKRKELLYYALYLTSILFVNYRNFEWNQLYFDYTIGNLAWFDTKVFHTSAIFLSYSVFVCIFLGLNNKKIKRLLSVVIALVATACILEVLSLIFMPQYGYFIYFGLRNVISVMGFIFILLMWRSLHPYAKYILMGTLILISSDIASNFLYGHLSSIVPTVGTVIEVMIFSTVLGYWTFNLYKIQIRKLHQSKMDLFKKNETIAQMRKEFAQDIHDELGSTITKLHLELYYQRQSKKDDNPFLQKIQHKIETLAKQIKDMVWLFDEGKSRFSQLQAQIRLTVHDMTSDTPIHVKFNMEEPSVDPDITLDMKRHIISAIKEAMTNILKHSKANSIKIRTSISKGDILINIKDDGIGFDPQSKQNSGNGILNMKNRIEKLRGTMLCTTSEKGTEVLFTVPLV